MDLNKLAVFVRVVDEGSFTRAARLLGQPKSRVSRRIAALERELGVALVYRTTRQLSATEPGRVLYERCRRHVYDLEAAAEGIRESSREVSGTLRLSATEDVGSALLGPLLSELGAIHPDLGFELRLSNEVLDLVKEGIDLAIRIGKLADSSLKARRIGQISLVPVASPGYLARAPRIESPGDLSDHPALVFDTEHGGDSWKLTARGRERESVRVRPRCRSNNPRVLLDLALAGQGVALIPEFLCLDAIRAGRLLRILEPYATRPFPVHFVWPAHRELSPKVRAFIDLGLERLRPYFA